VKALILNTSDFDGGADRAAYRLHQGLRFIGIDSTMLVQERSKDDGSIIGPQSKLEQTLNKSRPLLDTLPIRLYGHRQNVIFTPAALPSRIPHSVRKHDPDVVHMHWVGRGFLNVETISRMKRPMVWTLHDMWAFTGGCHYDQECGRYERSCGACPILGSSRERDLSRWIWHRKQRAYRAAPLTIVTPSRWLGDCAKKSALLKDIRVEVIPNGLDMSRYRPVEKNLARDLLGLPQNKRIILFGALASTSDPRKGFQHLQAALVEMGKQGWGERAELALLGSSAPKVAPDLGLPAHYMGRFSDDISLVLMYSAADVFVAPSVQENLANTVMEALACGTPCVAFDIGGMPDLIDHGVTGYLAQPYSARDLAEGIAWVLADDERRAKLAYEARAKAKRDYHLPMIAHRHRQLYEEILQ